MSTKNDYVRIAPILTLVIALTSASACAEAPTSEPAAACGDVARIYRDLQGGVKILGQRQTSEGSVEIEYEGTDAMNLPVQGSASCTFAVGEGGLSLMEAVIDGSPLDSGEIGSIRSRLGERQ